jgi:hypothetical protein
MAEEDSARRFLFDFFIHETENIHNRVDWFLIFHGILFEAFLAARYPVHRLTLGVLGSLVSYVWLVGGIRQLRNQRELVGAVKNATVMGPEAALLFKRMYENRSAQPGWMKWASALPAFCIWLPSAVLASWIVVTATYCEGGGIMWHGLIITLVAVVIVTFLWAWFSGKLFLSDQAAAAIWSRNDAQGPSRHEDGKS